MMWMRGIIVGLALAIAGAAGESRAQVLLNLEQRRAEEVAEMRVNDLRARASCHDQHALTKQMIWAGYSVNHLPPAARAERDAQLQEADQRLQDCLAQLQASVLRDTCRMVARTENQRARCD